MVQFSLDDVKTPERLELVLRQFQAAISGIVVPTIPSTQSLVTTLAPLIRNELQANGISPLNLQGLLPGGFTGTITVRNAAGSGTCTITVNQGIVTGTTC